MVGIIAFVVGSADVFVEVGEDIVAGFNVDLSDDIF